MYELEKKIKAFCKAERLTYAVENLPGGFDRFVISGIKSESEHYSIKPKLDKYVMPNPCFGLWNGSIMEGHSENENLYVMDSIKFDEMEKLAMGRWKMGFSWYMNRADYLFERSKLAVQRYELRRVDQAESNGTWNKDNSVVLSFHDHIGKSEFGKKEFLSALHDIGIHCKRGFHRSVFGPNGWELQERKTGKPVYAAILQA